MVTNMTGDCFYFLIKIGSFFFTPRLRLKIIADAAVSQQISGCTINYSNRLKSLKNAVFNGVFWVKMCKKWVFLVFFEAKYAFFEAFLGVKTGKKEVFSVVYASENV